MSHSPEHSTPNTDNSGSECNFVRDNAEAFALQALSDEETARIVAHLAFHPACQHFVDDAQAVVNLLPYSMPLLDAPGLAVKLQLFDRIAAESLSTALPSSRYERSGEIIDALNQAPRPAAHVSSPPPQRHWTQHLSTILVAPLAIALMVVSLWAYNLNDELNSVEENDGLDGQGQLLSNNMSLYSMESPCEECSARGQIGAMPDQTSAMLLAWGLDPDEEHEIWCEESNGQKWMVSPLEVDAEGAAMQSIKFPKPIEGYKRIFVSGSNDSASDAPELLVTLPEDHDDASETGSTPSW